MDIERIYSTNNATLVNSERAVTSFVNNRDFDSKAKAASKYATAMKQICQQVVVFNQRQPES